MMFHIVLYYVCSRYLSASLQRVEDTRSQSIRQMRIIVFFIRGCDSLCVIVDIGFHFPVIMLFTLSWRGVDYLEMVSFCEVIPALSVAALCIFQPGGGSHQGHPSTLRPCPHQQSALSYLQSVKMRQTGAKLVKICA